MDWARRSFHIDRITLVFAYAGFEMDIWYIRLLAAELFDALTEPLDTCTVH